MNHAPKIRGWYYFFGGMGVVNRFNTLPIRQNSIEKFPVSKLPLSLPLVYQLQSSYHQPRLKA